MKDYKPHRLVFKIATVPNGRSLHQSWKLFPRASTIWLLFKRKTTALMLLSPVNHRYLATKPNTPGPVAATATGPSPARKGGAEFKWKAVE